MTSSSSHIIHIILLCVRVLLTIFLTISVLSVSLKLNIVQDHFYKHFYIHNVNNDCSIFITTATLPFLPQLEHFYIYHSWNIFITAGFAESIFIFITAGAFLYLQGNALD